MSLQNKTKEGCFKNDTNDVWPRVISILVEKGLVGTELGELVPEQ
jgi:hypothetical protein